MHIALLNQFYPPARAPTGVLLRDLAETLCARGHRATIVTSPGIYGQTADEQVSGNSGGITVCRTGPCGRHRTGLVWKLFDYIRFFPDAYRVLSRLEPPPDAVVVMTTPPFCGLIAARLKKKRGAPYFLWCMDLYPEALAANGWMKHSGFGFRLLARMTRAERVDADGVITLGPDMTERIRRSVPQARISEVPVWSRLQPDPESVQKAKALRLQRGWADDEVILMYSGNMGRAHSIECLVKLAEKLRKTGVRIRMVFCGTGPASAQWKEAGGSLFEWLEPVGGDSLVAHLLAADIHLISQQADWTGVVVPSKYQAACALGRPVVFAGPVESAVAGWIQKADTGWILPPGDSGAIERLVQEVQKPALILGKGRRAARQAAEQFSPAINRLRIAELIEQNQK